MFTQVERLSAIISEVFWRCGHGWSRNSHAIPGGNSKGGKGFCDLVVVPRNHQGIGLFVELKVWSNFRENQLSNYRRAAKKKMPSLEPRIVTVTPFADPPAGSDRHVTWSEIFEMLKRATGGR